MDGRAVAAASPVLNTLGADALHAWTWRQLRRRPVGERLWADPTERVTTQATTLVLLALLLAVLAPVPLLLLAPLLFGVPHVAADLRHLVLNPPLPADRRLAWALALPLGAMGMLRAAWLLGAPLWPRVELCLGLGAVLAGGMLAGASTGPGAAVRRLVLVALLLVAPVVWWSPGTAALVVGHAHNLVAVGVWALFAAWHGVGAGRWWVVGLTGFATVITLLLPAPSPETAFAGLTMGDLTAALAPDLPVEAAGRVVRSFALLQAVHYAMWLACIPGTRATQPVPPSSSLRRWREDLGPGLAAAFVVGSLLLPALGLVDPAGARAGYLSLVLFHGWLELAVLASWTGRGLP